MKLFEINDTGSRAIASYFDLKLVGPRSPPV